MAKRRKTRMPTVHGGNRKILDPRILAMRQQRPGPSVSKMKQTQWNQQLSRGSDHGFPHNHLQLLWQKQPRPFGVLSHKLR